MTESIAALSFWQPYAWFIVNGYAAVDSRLWTPTPERIGPRFAVHAANRKVTRSEYTEFLTMVRDLKIKNYPESPLAFDYGAIVGTVQLTKVTRDSTSYFAHPGYFHWHLRHAVRFAPIKMKGQRGWFQIKKPD